ncbi:MAG TPA: aldo/keto reductase [Methanospirillum sp.]|uniref:aldo/keto reductase n=1 Tax=Methanospirillum sp. TaxID=45200 RepID=UPI002BA28FE5|nr:aldo/keto reductase [Methanospirillum sp.]HPY61204.1 aldo/keto reductase [Methanospirillum sp.]
MLSRIIPKTKEKIPILGFGCMRLVEKNGSIDEESSKALVRYAIEKGVTHLDTAWMYHRGQSEPFLGRALADGYRERVTLSTKLPHWLVKSREDMDFFLNSQLDRLKTGYIDYYLVHSVGGESWNRMKALGVTEFLDQAKKDGRIRNAGFSFHEGTESFKKIVDDYPWDCCLIQYNIIDEYSQAGRDGLKYAAEKDLAVFIMEPLRGGKLAKNLPEEINRILDQAEIKRTPAEWALRWLWDQPEVTMVLSGMNDISQVDENCEIAETAYPESLTAKEYEIIRNVAETWRSLMKVPCTGCQYCMPCPFGVNIPSCFEMYNNLFMFGEPWKTNAVYAIRLGGVMGGYSVASACIGCESCVSACPQGIDIPGRLKEVSERLEGPFYHTLRLGAKVALPVMRRTAFFKKRFLPDD